MRKTHLQAGVLSLLGTAYTKNYRNLRVDFEKQEEDGRGVGERYGDPVVVKGRMTFGGSFMRTVAGVRQTMLGMTVFSLDGTNRFGRMRGGTLMVRTETDEGSGGGDPEEVDYAVGTTIEGTADLQIATVAEFTSYLADNDNLALLQVTQPGFAATIPVQFGRAGHSIDVLRIQTEALSFSGKGSSGLVATGDPVLVSALTGSAVGAFSLDTGAKIYSAAGGMIVLSAGVTWGNGQIIEDAFEFKALGLATAVDPA